MSSVNSVSNIEHKTNVNAKSTKATKASGTNFESYLGESSSMDKIFDKAAAKYDVPVELLKAVGKQESNFNPNAVSRCGAQGVMQLMPATAKSLGVTDSFDAEQNIMGGAKYLSGLLKKYDGNVKLALAAYNAGSGNVAKYGGVPPFEETQNYVKKVMGYMKGTDQSGSSVTSTSNTKTNTTNTNDTTNGTSSTNTSTSASSSTQINSTNSVDTSETNTSSFDTASDLDDIFTYDDYLRFLQQFLEEEKEKDQENNQKSTYLASKQLSYSIPVMNLLNTNSL